MFSTLHEDATRDEPAFPCLMRYTDDKCDYTVLLVGPSEGTVVWVGPEHKGQIELGDWGPDWSTSLFTRFDGKIILSNEQQGV